MKYKDSLSIDSQKRLQRGSILRILDSKEDKDKSILQEAPSITPYLTEDCKRVLNVCSP